MSKHLATVGWKNSLLTERNSWQYWAQGGADICSDRLGVRGGRQSMLIAQYLQSRFIPLMKVTAEVIPAHLFHYCYLNPQLV